MVRRFSIYALFAVFFIPQTSLPMTQWLASNVLEKAIQSSGIVEKLAGPAASGGAVFLSAAALLKLVSKTKIIPQSRVGRLGISAVLGVLTMHYLTDGALWNELIEFRKENKALFKELSKQMEDNQAKNDDNFENLKEGVMQLNKKIQEILNMLGDDFPKRMELIYKQAYAQQEKTEKKLKNQHFNNANF